jgi:hypothetical protein
MTEQLTVLLDLKQKQANISEARSSRLQAEQANEQANETVRQGTIIMLVGALVQTQILYADLKISSRL